MRDHLRVIFALNMHQHMHTDGVREIRPLNNGSELATELWHREWHEFPLSSWRVDLDATFAFVGKKDLYVRPPMIKDGKIFIEKMLLLYVKRDLCAVFKDNTEELVECADKSLRTLRSTKYMKTIRDSILSHSAECYVDPLEAVVEWGIQPYPYALYEVKDESGAHIYLIVHKAFNARLPTVFTSIHDAQKAFADILISKPACHAPILLADDEVIIECDGQKLIAQRFALVSDSQPLFFNDLLQSKILKMRLRQHFNKSSQLRTDAEYLYFMPGFSLLPRNLFSKIKRQNECWYNTIYLASLNVSKKSKKVWNALSHYEHNEADSGAYSIAMPTYHKIEIPDIEALRNKFPSLHGFSDLLLARLYEKFLRHCESYGFQTANQDFMLYVLQYILTQNSDVPERGLVDGLLFAFSILQTHMINEDSTAFARKYSDYDKKIYELERRVINTFVYQYESRNGKILHW